MHKDEGAIVSDTTTSGADFERLYRSSSNGIGLEEYAHLLRLCTPHQMQSLIQKFARTPLHSMLDQDDSVAVAKVSCLLEHASRLGINVNAQLQFKGLDLPDHAKWHNTALHQWIANERFGLAKAFLDSARKYNLKVDLNTVEQENKTPFMLAVKMGNAPIDLVAQLISAENYNMPDNTNTTPLMFACAMRRVDIAKLIIQQEADRLGLGKLDFNNLSPQQKQSLAPFINQQHPTNKKSLGHYAVMRCGAEKTLAQPNSYQLTILNIAKSVGIDARRDKNAPANAATNDTTAQVSCSAVEISFYEKIKSQGVLKTLNLEKLGLEQDLTQTDMVFTELSYRGVEQVTHALLASKRNAFLLHSKTQGENAAVYTNIPAQIAQYAGISYAESILHRTRETVQFLASIGLDFSLTQQQEDKTPASYVEALKRPKTADKANVTTADTNNIVPLYEQLVALAKQATNTYNSGALSFNAFTS